MWITVRGQILGWLVVCYNQALKHSFKAESKSRWCSGLPRVRAVPYMRHIGWVWGMVSDTKGFGMGLSLFGPQSGWVEVGSLSVSKEVWFWVLPCPDPKGFWVGFGLRTQGGWVWGPIQMGLGAGTSLSVTQMGWVGVGVRTQGGRGLGPCPDPRGLGPSQSGPQRI
jgi:hypothetical protein